MVVRSIQLRELFSRPILSFLLSGLMLLALSAPAQALSQVTATVDKNPVFANEPFSLHVIADDILDSDAFSAVSLRDKGFVVGQTSTSHNSRSVNGKTRNQTRWRTDLLLTEPGQYQIPAFELGGLSSKPLTIEVQPAPTGTSQLSADEELFLTARLSRSTAWPGQQILYTVRLWLALDIQRGSLSDPEHDQLIISQLGQDRELSEIVNGIRYRVIERQYSVTPRTAGEFVLESPVFDGLILRPDRRQQRFMVPVQKAAPALSVTVKAPPADGPDPWLVGSAGLLQERWEPQLALADNSGSRGNHFIIEAGTPVTRTLTLGIAGSQPDLLPKLDIRYPDGLRIYPDQIKSGSQPEQDTLVAWRSESQVIIATQPGKLTLPAVRVAWWNAETEQTEISELPERILHVVAAPGTGATTGSGNSGSDITAATDTESDKISDDTPHGDTDTRSGEALTVPPALALQRQLPSQQPAATPLWRTSALLLAVLWLMTLAGWWWHARRYRIQPQATGDAAGYGADSDSERAHWQSLKQALKQNQAGQIAGLMQRWLTARYGVVRLELLAAHCPSELGQALMQEWQQLCQARYGRDSGAGPETQSGHSQWQGQPLLSLLSQARKQVPSTQAAAATTGTHGLTALYPAEPAS